MRAEDAHHYTDKPLYVKALSFVAGNASGLLDPDYDYTHFDECQWAAEDAYAQAGITDPRREIDMVEMYVPFSWFEPMWLENLLFCEEGEGWKLVEGGVTQLDGDLPVNCSGGVLSSNPIGASGMLRFAEAALQVRGLAGEHQVDGVRTALGHAYGGGSQFFAMWVVGAEKP